MTAAVATRPGPIGQPDIDYAPSLAKYQARVKRRQQTEDLNRTLPPGFPSKLYSPLVWDGDSESRDQKWVYELTQDDLDEIEAALAHFKCSLASSTIRHPTNEVSTGSAHGPHKSRDIPSQ